MDQLRQVPRASAAGADISSHPEADAVAGSPAPLLTPQRHPATAHARGGARIGLSWLAAYLLVFQALISGLALGAMAAPAGNDGFILCLGTSTDQDHGGPDTPSKAHDCFACPLAGGTPVLPGPLASPLKRAFVVLAPEAGRSDWPLLSHRAATSARPRAPPATA